MFKSSLLQPIRYADLTVGVFYAEVQPTAIENPRLVHLNRPLAAEFGLTADDFSSENFLSILAGAELPTNLKPLAMAYSGHQFGSFNPTLGDGRAIMMNEFKDQAGQHWEFQLKGSGPTPYSRGFDGRAVLRSTIREYLCSEALWALGVPTTRALCLVDSDTPVKREQIESAAMMVRVSPSHIRFGSFERFFYSRKHEQLKALMEHCIKQDFPDLAKLAAPERYEHWFKEVLERTAHMVAHWQAVGFCHGVMNTDNFSILGLTFDFGPFGFLETYDPKHICNHSDHEGRYAYNQQPRVGFWNCLCLAQAISPWVEKDKLEAILETYEDQLQGTYIRLLRRKLGLVTEQAKDSNLVLKLLTVLEQEQLDYSRFFRGLSHYQQSDTKLHPWLQQQSDGMAVSDWLTEYKERLAAEDRSEAERQQSMLKTNPKYVLRNYVAQRVIELAEQGNYGPVGDVLKLLHHPFDEHPEFENLAESAPEWAQGLEVSCSS